ncbi:DUF2443 domain-containing protein [Helicobacter cholecystus]|uniref:DUF2443 domain-containing protein n=1 Tax=Helicobacter cholecystus TaxID=45498 RepID=A0A3D8IYG8_9HELI|nr:DUF2443 family protein [Helicobacter cholecystus]RDU70036.1 DUF2443 domain-containing protein [Helicobacter cholecystus]VEJ24797.1 Protein of uncharacterised function (DUF2443) [Helicobacter cholecystus]
MTFDPLLQRIDQIYGEIETAKEELQIALNLACISMQDYILIKRGSKDMPEDLSDWAFEEINTSAQKLKQALDQMNKLRKEFFVV